MLSQFSSACYYGLGHFHIDGANLHMQTHLVSKIMHQNLAVILCQYNYSKNSFIVLIQSNNFANFFFLGGGITSLTKFRNQQKPRWHYVPLVCCALRTFTRFRQLNS